MNTYRAYRNSILISCHLAKFSSRLALLARPAVPLFHIEESFLEKGGGSGVLKRTRILKVEAKSFFTQIELTARGFPF